MPRSMSARCCLLIRFAAAITRVYADAIIFTPLRHDAMPLRALLRYATMTPAPLLMPLELPRCHAAAYAPLPLAATPFVIRCCHLPMIDVAFPLMLRQLLLMPYLLCHGYDALCCYVID